MPSHCRMPDIFVGLAIAVILFSCEDAAASRAPASSRGYSVTLEGTHGATLPTFHHQGATYVLGAYGDRYNVRVTNHTGQRVEAVVTVDGRDVITGDVGDYIKQRGYIIGPHASVLVEGFRRNMSTVAAFRFTRPGDSYSARRGTPRNVGVVGVAVFTERVRRPPPVAMAVPKPSRKPGTGRLADDFDAPEAEMRAAEATPSPVQSGSADALGASKRRSRPAPRNNLGTQYGENQQSRAFETRFERKRPGHPRQLLSAYYDDAAGLSARGIQVYPRYSGDPSPFPNQQRFAPPPP